MLMNNCCAQGGEMMEFKAKLNVKFFIFSILLLAGVVLGWYGVYFMNANEILMEDNTPMNAKTKLFFTVAESLILLSWTLSFFTLVRQALFGYAFALDENGIHTTATAIIVLAFVFVIPIRTIPFSAVEKVTEDDGVFTLHIEKAKIDIIPILRIFARKRYNLFSGFTVEKQDVIKANLKSILNKIKFLDRFHFECRSQTKIRSRKRTDFYFFTLNSSLCTNLSLRIFRKQ